jgi:hypothetical protein
VPAVKRLLVIGLLMGCEASNKIDLPICMVDSQCSTGQVCFPDGCGDPGEGIVVEITGDNSVGLFPQDVPIGDAGVSSAMPFEIAGPLLINGSVIEGDTSTGMFKSYAAPVTVRAVGESELIPGITRTYERNIDALNSGFYFMPIATGRYSVTVVASTAVQLAPQTDDDKVIAMLPDGGYEAPSANVTFADNALPIIGTVIKTSRAGVPPVDVLPDVQMQLQAFDPSTGKPLSQAPQVSKTTGVFTLSVDPAASQLSSISVLVSPLNPASLAPSKTFVLPVNGSMTAVKLALGDYGGALPQVPGTLLGSDGNPVAGATVQIAGTVSGGGTFKARALTDSDGGFAADLLASEDDSSMLLTAFPPPNSPAGILQVPIGVIAAGSGGHLTQPVLTCPDRIMVTGRLLRPDGSTAEVMATVTATPIEKLDAGPMPISAATVTTDQDGRYQFFLDPAIYRFDFVPPAGDALPQKSRLVRIDQAVDSDAGTISNTIPLDDFELSSGRTVSGTVSVRGLTDPPMSGVLTPNALLRFFRVTSVEGQTSSLLIGQAITDDTGAYQLILPDHPTATALYLNPPDAGSNQQDAGSP